MIVVMQEGATEDQVQAVIDRMVEMDFTIHRSTGMVHIVLGGVGPEERVNPADFENLLPAQTQVLIPIPFGVEVVAVVEFGPEPARIPAFFDIAQ